MRQLWFLYRFPGWLLFNIKYLGANRSIFDRANADFMRKSQAQQFIASSMLYIGIISIWGLSASGFWDQNPAARVQSSNTTVASSAANSEARDANASASSGASAQASATPTMASNEEGTSSDSRESMADDASLASTPSFNCEMVTGAVDKMICANPELASDDRELANLYKQVMAKAQGSDADRIRNDQRTWLNEERNGCEDVNCLTAAYAQRIGFLKNDLAAVSQSEQ